MVGTSPSSAGGVGSISVGGAKIPYAFWPKDRKVNNRGSIVTNLIDFKNGAHKKKKTFKKYYLKKKQSEVKDYQECKRLKRTMCMMNRK